MITSFKDRYFFLSNFYPCTIEFNSRIYPSTEHAYQSAKAVTRQSIEKIRLAPTPSEAKRLGGRLTKIHHQWNSVKLGVMERLIDLKFNIPELRLMLIDTGDVEIVEMNTWGDTFWGVCDGHGENHLGLILMRKRESLKVA